ncbi:MAG TPA: putative toxin-antitoxin system toxin component, PIN family [Thermodesulfovibrionales bacterium]|nr:putative toxin-antitoxin system toxin component, PIN family [Thermodesulfovibrionales bacterium]
MGEKKEVKKVVLDTNILVSALLFKGDLSKIVDLWKEGRIIPVVSGETFEEFRSVLEYPKFSLTGKEIKTIIEDEVLPFFETVDMAHDAKGACRDPEDDKFLACALSASADYIVSGDKDLCDMGRYKSIRIMEAADFLKMFK